MRRGPNEDDSALLKRAATMIGGEDFCGWLANMFNVRRGTASDWTTARRGVPAFVWPKIATELTSYNGEVEGTLMEVEAKAEEAK